MPRVRKQSAQPKVVSDKGYCRACEKILPRDNFYEATNLMIDKNGLMSICKNHCNEIYNNYFSIYNNLEKALYLTCQDLDIMFSIEALKQTQSHIEQLISRGKSHEKPFGYYKSKLSSIGKNNAGLDSLRFKDSDTLKENIQNTEFNNYDNQNYDKLILKWGNLPTSDIQFLENEYIDWCRRYDVSSKAMEVNIKYICHQQLTINKKQEAGQPVDKELKTIGDLMGNSALKPIQESAAMSAEFNTLGTWIKKFENEEPFPEPDEELKDVDGFKKYIRVWFLGHMCKILGLDNEYSQEYDEELLTHTINFDDSEDDFEYDENDEIEGDD